MGINSITSMLGYVKRKDLGSYDLEAFLLSLPEGSLQARAKRTLSASPRHARRWKMLRENIMKFVSVEGTNSQGKVIQAYGAEELAQILELFRGGYLKPAIILMGFCSVRNSKMLGHERISTIADY
jgi:hypothetical protein